MRYSDFTGGNIDTEDRSPFLDGEQEIHDILGPSNYKKWTHYEKTVLDRALLMKRESFALTDENGLEEMLLRGKRSLGEIRQRIRIEYDEEEREALYLFIVFF